MGLPRLRLVTPHWQQRDVSWEPTTLDSAPCAGWFQASVPKCDISSLELPLFALKAGDKFPRVYVDSRHRVEIIPGPLGAATQRDKDIVLFCMSQLMLARNRGQSTMNRKVRTSAHAILRFCGRGTAGKDYDRLMQALTRLRDTRILTDCATGGKLIREPFGLIEFYIEREKDKSARILFVEILISDWMFNSVLVADVLSISGDYFSLSSSLARRIYEIARKHCGRQPKWEIGIERLLSKSGCRLPLREFRRSLKRIASSAGQGIPDFRMVIERKRDVVTFYSCKASGHTAELSDRLAKATSPGFSKRPAIAPVDNL